MHFTEIEQEIMTLVAQQKRPREIAAIITQRRGRVLAEATVRSHLNRIVLKLPNPLSLTPIAAVRHYMGERMAS